MDESLRRRETERKRVSRREQRYLYGDCAYFYRAALLTLSRPYLLRDLRVEGGGKGEL